MVVASSLHCLFHAAAAILAFAVLAAAAAAGGRRLRESAVLSLREFEWGEGKAQSYYSQANTAKMLGKHKPTAATRVLELRHHLLTTAATSSGIAADDQEGYLRRLLDADEARAASLQLRPRASPQSRGQDAQVPLSNGIRFQTLNYITTIALGSGADLTVIVDTGSDLTWVQCKPCASCYAQHDPLFDPAGSATYATVPCNATACADSLRAATGTPGACGASTRAGASCYYALAYGDGSFSRGVLAMDTVGLGGVTVDKFVFGCGLSNRGLFGGTAGLMGLGRTALSLVSQTAARFGGVFSYCLPATMYNSTGSLALGGDTSVYRNTTPVAHTRMIADPAQPPFYFVNLTGAAVGGMAVHAPAFGAANVLLDSGTVITRLAPSAYHAIRAEFTRQFAAYPAAPPFSILDTCYNLTGHEEVKVPLLTLQYEGGGDMTVDAAGMLFTARKDGSLVCLALASLADEDQTQIIGNYQQKNKRVVYDTVGSRIGFADEDCNLQ